MKQAPTTMRAPVVPLAPAGSADANPELLAVLRWLNRHALASRFPRWAAVGLREDGPLEGAET